MSYLKLREVSKSYGAGATLVQALSDINLSVDGGRLLAVMGPSKGGQVDESIDSASQDAARTHGVPVS